MHAYDICMHGRPQEFFQRGKIILEGGKFEIDGLGTIEGADYKNTTAN